MLGKPEEQLGMTSEWQRPCLKKQRENQGIKLGGVLEKEKGVGSEERIWTKHIVYIYEILKE